MQELLIRRQHGQPRDPQFRRKGPRGGNPLSRPEEPPEDGIPQTFIDLQVQGAAGPPVDGDVYENRRTAGAFHIVCTGCKWSFLVHHKWYLWQGRFVSNMS
jgi:hypothetical protein